MDYREAQAGPACMPRFPYRTNTMAPIDHEVRRKAGLFLLAAVCAMLAGAGLQSLVFGTAPMDAVQGGGRLLLWGSVGASLLARVHGRRLPGAYLGFWTGAGLLLASWV